MNLSFLREIFSEPNGGTLSWGRVASAICLGGALIWVSHTVFITHALPALDGITGFILAPYLSNKAATAAQNIFSKSGQ